MATITPATMAPTLHEYMLRWKLGTEGLYRNADGGSAWQPIRGSTNSLVTATIDKPQLLLHWALCDDKQATPRAIRNDLWA